MLHLPSTKVASSEGEDVYWASREGDTDPSAALQNHLQVNQPSEASHLFAYRIKNACRLLTKSKFLEKVEKAACAASLELLQGHGIWISSTLEYLLQGVPFDVMKAQGHWARDSFLLYLWKHAVIIAPCQACPAQNFHLVHHAPSALACLPPPSTGTHCQVSPAAPSLPSLGVLSLTCRVINFLTGWVSKHIPIKYHAIREYVEAGAITLVRTPTGEMLADGLTKSLPKASFDLLVNGLGFA